jgi:hypothetical protein
MLILHFSFGLVSCWYTHLRQVPPVYILFYSSPSPTPQPDCLFLIYYLLLFHLTTLAIWPQSCCYLLTMKADYDHATISDHYWKSKYILHILWPHYYFIKFDSYSITNMFTCTVNLIGGNPKYWSKWDGKVDKKGVMHFWPIPPTFSCFQYENVFLILHVHDKNFDGETFQVTGCIRLSSTNFSTYMDIEIICSSGSSWSSKEVGSRPNKISPPPHLHLRKEENFCLII